jgi:hypothetical protein
MALLLDSLKMQWTRYVIGFSFYDQKEILKKVTLPFRLKGLPHVQFRMLRTYMPALLAVIAACLIIYYRLSSFRTRRYGFVTASYLELRALLKKRGCRLTDSTTAGDIRDMTHASSMTGAVHELVRLYELHRFGKRQVTAEQKRQYERLLAEIKAAKR